MRHSQEAVQIVIPVVRHVLLVAFRIAHLVTITLQVVLYPSLVLVLAMIVSSGLQPPI